MLKTTLVFVFIMSYFFVYEQDIKKMFLNKISFFEIDVVGNLYVVQNNEVKKYNNEDKIQKTYINLNYGDISSIDVGDALNTLIYYKDFNKIIMLDNQLSVKNTPIDLTDLGYSQTTQVCLSYNNGFWIFEPINHELIRYNQLLEITDRTGNLFTLTGILLNPEQIIERDNKLYLRDKKNGIFVFDKYGGYLKQMPFLNIDDFYIRSEKWQMLKNDTSFIYNPKTLSMDTVLLSASKILEFRFNEKASYIRFENGVFEKKIL